MNKTTILVALTPIISGCASQVVPVDDGTFYLAHQSAWCSAASADFVKEEALGKAAKFCASRNKKAEITFARGRGGILGRECAIAWINFRCSEGVGK